MTGPGTGQATQAGAQVGTQVAVTVIGPDRPGIIADVTGALAGAGVNLEDSTMTLLRGHFAMMLVGTGAGLAEVERAVAPLAGELVVTVREVGPETSPAPVGPAYLLSVHGADRPGIVSAITRVVAAAGGNITDLSTRLSGTLYVLTAEVDLPATADPDQVRRALDATATGLGVGVTLVAAETDEL
jgi:glycine cleavage system transcriptional repressor